MIVFGKTSRHSMGVFSENFGHYGSVFDDILDIQWECVWCEFFLLLGTVWEFEMTSGYSMGVCLKRLFDNL